MIRQLIWFVLGWEGPIPIHTYSGAEYLIAFAGAGGAFALFYAGFFFLGFRLCRRATIARVGARIAAIAGAAAWFVLALDWFLFNTTLIVGPMLLVTLSGVMLYLFFKKPNM